MVSRVERGRSWNRCAGVVLAAGAVLAAAALFPVLAPAQPPAKVAIEHLEIPAFIGPNATSAGVGATYAVLPTDGLESHGSVQFRFFLRQTIDIRNPAGVRVRTLTGEKELVPPPGPNASRPVPVSLKVQWDGRDDAGSMLPEGHYGVTVSGTIVRVKNPPPRQPPGAPGFVHVIGTASDAGTTVLDFTPPALAAAPTATLVHRLGLEVLLTYSDGGSGVNLSSLRATANGQNASSALVDVTPTSARLVLSGPAFLHEGDNLLAFALADNAGNLKAAEVTVRILIPHHIVAEALSPVVLTHARTILAGTVYNVDGIAVPGVSGQFARGAGTTTFENAGAGPVSGTTDETGRVAVAAFPGFGDNAIRLSLPDFPGVAPVDLTTRGAAWLRVALSPAGPIQAGSARSMTLLAIDANGAPITEYSGIADVHTTDPHSLLNHFSVAFDGSEGGTITADYTAFFVTAGTQSITANDTRDPGLISTLDGIVVVPGPPRQFLAVSGTTWTTVVVGATPPPAIVRMLDDFDNPVPGRQVDATVSAAGAADAVYSATTDAAGMAQVDLPAFDTPGVRTVTLRAAGTDLTAFGYRILVFAAQAAGTVGAAGGEVAVSDSTSPAFGARLVVPAGSVAANVSLGISALPGSAAGLPAAPPGLTPIGSAIDFGPAGVPLAGPITLVIPYREADIPAGVAETSLVLLRLDLATGAWVEVADVVHDTAANTLTVVVQDLAGSAFGGFTPEAPPPASAIHLRIAGGDDQKGVMNRCARQALTVQALDADNVPVPGVPIAFSLAAGGGAIVDAPGWSRSTDSTGTAGVHYLFGAHAGVNKIQASVRLGSGTEPVTFTETCSYPTVTLDGVVDGKYTARVLGEPGNMQLGVGVSDPSGQWVYGTPLSLEGTESKVYVVPRIEPANFGITHFEVIPLKNTLVTLRLPDYPQFMYKGSLVDQVTIWVEAPPEKEPGRPWYAPDPAWTMTSIVSEGQGQVVLAWEQLGPIVLDLTEFRSKAKEHFASDGIPGTFQGFWLVLDNGKFFLPDAGSPDAPFKVTLKNLTAPGSIGSMAIVVDAEIGYSAYPGALPVGNGVSGLPNDLTLDFARGVAIQGPPDFTYGDGTPGFYAHGEVYSYDARIGFGLPEIRVVEETSTGSGVFQPLERIRPGLFFDVLSGSQKAYDPNNQFFVEYLGPLRGPATRAVNLLTLDACGDPAGRLPRAAAPTALSARLSRIGDMPRYAIYRSGPILATPSFLPAGAAGGEIASGPGGEILLQLKAGSGVFVAGTGAMQRTRDFEVVPSGMAYTAQGGVVPPGPQPVHAEINVESLVTDRLMLFPAPLTLSSRVFQLPGFDNPAPLVLTNAAGNEAVQLGLSAPVPEGLFADCGIFTTTPRGPLALGAPDVVIPPQTLIQVVLGEAEGVITKELTFPHPQVPDTTNITGKMQYQTAHDALDNLLSPTALALAWTIRNRVAARTPDRFYANSSTYVDMIQAVRNDRYQYDPVNPANGQHDVYDAAVSIAKWGEKDHEPDQYLVVVPSVAKAFLAWGRDPTQGSWGFVTPTREQIAAIKAALAAQRTGAANDPAAGPNTVPTGYLPRFTLLQVVIFNNVPDFVFFRDYPTQPPNQPSVVILPDVTGN